MAKHLLYVSELDSVTLPSFRTSHNVMCNLLSEIISCKSSALEAAFIGFFYYYRYEKSLPFEQQNQSTECLILSQHSLSNLSATIWCQDWNYSAVTSCYESVCFHSSKQVSVIDISYLGTVNSHLYRPWYKDFFGLNFLSQSDMCGFTEQIWSVQGLVQWWAGQTCICTLVGDGGNKTD